MVRTDSNIPKLPLTDTSDGITTIGQKAYFEGWVGFASLHKSVNCSEALTRPKSNFLYSTAVPRLTAAEIVKSCQKSCETFRQNYGFERYPKVTKEEHHFPIAFIILFHTSLDQVLFLLRAIYRPQNVYCLTVDLNAKRELLEGISAVSSCFHNVFVASKLERVVYAGFSRLVADLHCMEDLLAHPIPWKYVINLPGQQFPLK
ncbi:beta-1,3-galactosyl-o-glycosyl-glycoprotein beta-1,6-n-acetylglucosaminyltransferase-like [Plakobranchus ocellatus]|uniref:Beta-1,3-galactosyl-o-glycosyl-glycoprotein beta-1,6-n-acetylglucosaminyltransferase-like n=1 Tax=Plakobranchus ocellatus TaxID=259542 RepID=A0AAV3YCU4_9GAST|nr:beta-1,3-galactosyl-o-glycosyl-glycoprotein beta-1,6-n-acetylglucosaminyltransferase-like [Plakobranchus ocellatus]